MKDNKTQNTVSLLNLHPWLRIIIGRCGSGKSTTACAIMDGWRREGGGPILAIDPVASDPPTELHIASCADVYTPDCPDILPTQSGQLVVVDEADLFVSQADAYRRPLPPLHGLIRRRRHAGVSLLLISQRAALISRSAWSLADEIIICSTSDDRDLKQIGKLPGVTAEDVQAVAAAHEPGVVLVWTPREVRRG